MSTDLTVFITVAGLLISVATFIIGRQTASKNDGKAAGALETDLKYVKESVGRIESKLDRDTQRLEGRIDEISKQIVEISNEANRGHESAKSSHNRIDEHLDRYHLSPLAYIIPGIFAELSAATGFYYWKAKAENMIKLDIERQRLKLDPRNEPGDSSEEKTPPDPTAAG